MNGQGDSTWHNGASQICAKLGAMPSGTGAVVTTRFNFYNGH